VADLFNFLTGFAHPQPFRKLLVAPFTLRERLVEQIRAVRSAATDGQEARICIKVNNLTDEEIINELYRASQAGAKVDIVTRSICTLRPGVPGMSEGIRVRSILGRFLEHSRLFIFTAGKESSYFLGSADLMPRNLDHRIELVTPVEDARAQNEMSRTFDVLLADNTTAWELSPDGHWMKLRPRKGDRGRAAQQVFMRSARARARRRAANVRTP
jgi:polyphosphate kinase